MLLEISGGQMGALVGACALLILSLVLVAIGFWSLRWPKVVGVIKVSIYDQEWQSETIGSDTTFSKQDKFYLAYAFEVQGQEYLSSGIRPNGDLDWRTTTPGLSSAADKSHRYSEGKAVDVYYCPLWPKWSCLEPGGFLMPAIVFFASIGMFAVCYFQS